MRKKILFVESSCIGAAYTAQAAIALGFTPVFLTAPSGSQGDTRSQILEYEHLECDTGSVDAMVAAVQGAGLQGAYAVASLSDVYLSNSIGLARRLGIRGLNPAIERLKDKGEVYRLIPEFSPRSVLFSSAAVPREEIAALLGAAGAVMIKGRRSSGGLGAFVLRTPEDIARVPALIAAARLPSHQGPEQWIAQELLDGVLVSLEGYVAGPRTRFLGFSGRKKVGMAESMIMFPWDDRLPAAAAEEARTAVRQLVMRSGFANGYFHIEFIIQGERARVIDANVGRIGGGGLGQQLAISFGVSPRAVHAHVLALGIEGKDLAGDKLFQAAPQPTISVMYGIPKQATLHAVHLPPGFRCLHTGIVDPGEVVPKMGQDNYSWIGIVSGEAAHAPADTARISIATSAGELHAVF